MATNVPHGATRTWQIGPDSSSWFIGLGATFALLGALACFNLFIGTMSAPYVIAMTSAALCMLMLVYGASTPVTPWSVLWFAGALVYGAAAITISRYPVSAAGLVMTWLALLVAATGVMRITLALRFRNVSWRAMLLSGLGGVAAAVLLWRGWPSDAMWMLSFIFAGDLVLEAGAALLLGLALRIEEQS